MIEIAYAAIAAYGAFAAAEQQHLARLTPEQRVLYVARKAEERKRQQAADDQMRVLAGSLEIRQGIGAERRTAQERLDREPEVVLARKCIDREGLVGATADHLLAFARELASRRA